MAWLFRSIGTRLLLTLSKITNWYYCNTITMCVGNALSNFTSYLMRLQLRLSHCSSMQQNLNIYYSSYYTKLSHPCSLSEHLSLFVTQNLLNLLITVVSRLLLFVISMLLLLQHSCELLWDCMFCHNQLKYIWTSQSCVLDWCNLNLFILPGSPQYNSI